MKLSISIAGTGTRALPAVVCIALVAGACAPTIQTGKVKPSGFLGDYSQLRKGDRGEAQLVYINPNAKWASYTKVLIEPVTVWRSADATPSKAETASRQQLANYLHATLAKQLEDGFTVVAKPGPGVLRIRVAITEARGATVALDTISTFLVYGRVASEVGHVLTGGYAFVGKAALEAEILDSTTGQRLAAAVDERSGRKSAAGVFSKWSDVTEAYDYWAKRLNDRLVQERGK